MIVTPAPGVPGAVPFWKGDGLGRPRELGEAIGAFARWAVDQEPATLAHDFDLDDKAATNLVEFLREQQEATRVVPSDRTIVIERFRDEIGDWRVCVLSPFGGRVHAAWGLALSARIREEHGLESDAIWSDDGIIVHLPDADEPPGAELMLIDPDELEDLVVGELGGSALFGARFRENAGRALLIPRAYPGRRTPLWQQRLKSQSLLEVARRYAQFPIVLETYREVLRDVLDLPGLHELLTKLHRRELSLVEVETPTASPVRVLAAVRLRRDLHVRGRPAQRRAPRGRAGAGPRAAARAARPGGAARADRAGRAGDRRGRPAAALRPHPRRQRRRPARRAAPRRRPHARRGDAARRHATRGSSSCAASGARSSCASAARSAGSRPRTPACTATRSAPCRRPACPEAFIADVPDAMERLVRRYARTHGPFETRALRERYGLDLTPVLERLEQSGDLVRGELRPGGTQREWCDPEVLRRLRRASLAALRAEIEPADQRAFARFQACWQGVDRHPPGGAGVDRLREVLVPLPGPGAAARGVGARRAAAPHRRLLARVAGPAVRERRGRVGRRRRARPPLRPRRALLPRRRAADRPAAARRRAAGGARPRGRPRAAARRPVLLHRPADRRLRLHDRGAAERAVGPRVGRRGDQRRVRAAALAEADRDAVVVAAGARRAPAHVRHAAAAAARSPRSRAAGR